MHSILFLIFISLLHVVNNLLHANYLIQCLACYYIHKEPPSKKNTIFFLKKKMKPKGCGFPGFTKKHKHYLCSSPQEPHRESHWFQVFLLCSRLPPHNGELQDLQIRNRTRKSVWNFAYYKIFSKCHDPLWTRGSLWFMLHEVLSQQEKDQRAAGLHVFSSV